jgi:hypothetical protein
MENSGSNVFTETEIEKAATALLRKQRLNAGDFEHDDDFYLSEAIHLAIASSD